MVEASAAGLKDWRSILEWFRSDYWISKAFQDMREKDCSKGFIVGRETFNDPYADCKLVSKELWEFWKKTRRLLNAARISEQIPDPRDWTVTVICARLTFIFTTTEDNGRLETP